MAPKGMEAETKPSVLFCWLHLSDIHFGSGNQEGRSSKQYVTNHLIVDLESCWSRAKDAPPHPQAIFVTGDIAHRGADDEYESARAWFKKIFSTTELTPRDLYLVPGNHDVRRTPDTERQTKCRFHYFVAKISGFSVHFGPLNRDFGCSGVGFAQQMRRYRSGHACIRVESQLRAAGEIATICMS